METFHLTNFSQSKSFLRVNYASLKKHFDWQKSIARPISANQNAFCSKIF